MGMDADLVARSLVVAATSVAAVLVANWLVARLGQPIAVGSKSSAAAPIAATILWIGLMILAGLLALRYIERIPNAVAGYAALAVTVTLLSMARAFLYRRAEAQHRARRGMKPDSMPAQKPLRGLTYLLTAVSLYLLYCVVTGRSPNLGLLVPVAIGTLLPDLDSRVTLTGRLIPPLSRWLEDRVGPRQEWHSLGAAIVMAAITLPLVLLAGWEPWAMIPLGFVGHLLREALELEGLMLFWPLSRTRYLLFRGRLVQRANDGERELLVFLLVVALGLLLAMKLSREESVPAVSPASSPFEEILAQYQALRGRSLVYADVDGVWQASGQTVNARYEIIGAVDQSLILLDRYSGELLAGGHSADDPIYLIRVSFLTGAEVRIKPVEVNLREGRLAEALPVVYQMQRDPGLQHMFVSGDLAIAVPGEQAERALNRSYGQARLPKIQKLGEGHYRLRYLTASELIELADVPVISADLMIVATSAVAASSATATPLPQPPSGLEGKVQDGGPMALGSSRSEP